MSTSTARRQFIRTAAAGLLLAAPGAIAAEAQGEEGIPATEDLMREHGLLKRVLLVYGEVLRRMDANEQVPPEAVADAAKIIRSFIEDYHEKLEEEFLFPRFRKANKLVDLVQVLQAQHQAGRRVTDITLQFATAQGLANPDNRAKLANSLRQFIRMYNPHEAREDTILFPAFRTIVSKKEFEDLSEEFEKREDQLFGEGGFEKNVDKVAQIEKTLNIEDLSRFTPQI